MYKIPNKYFYVRLFIFYWWKNAFFLQRIQGVQQPLTYLPNWNYEIYNNRLRTFNSFKWGYIKKNYTAEMFAEIGFIYIVEENILVCVFCFLQCDQLSYKEEDILEKHKKKQRCCGNIKHTSIKKKHLFFNFYYYYHHRFSSLLGGTSVVYDG